MASSSMTPRLLHDLHLALSSLYNDPNQHGRNAHHHSFLMEFQTRNIRRRIQSQLQRWIDKKQQQQQQLALPQPGSSWLACVVALLLSRRPVNQIDQQQQQNYYRCSYEMQLFCAQTILHRLRRMKITEAVDFEMEDETTMQMLVSLLGNNTTAQNDTTAMKNHCINTSYQRFVHIIQEVDPSVGHILLVQGSEIFNGTVVDEQHVKAQSTVLLLAAIAYQMILYNVEEFDPNITPSTESWSSSSSSHRPLFATITAAFATAVFRFRYCFFDTSGQSQQQTVQTLQSSQGSLLQIMQSVLQFVKAHLEIDQGRNPLHGMHDHREDAMWLLTMASVSALPSTLFDTGGARGRVSVDPQVLQHARNELIHMDTSILLSLISRNPLEHALQKSLILGLCAQWAKCLPLSMEFLQQIVIPLVNDALQCGQSLANVTYRNDALRVVMAIFEAAVVSEEDILAITLGLSESNNATKKPSSRSRKRRSAIIQNSTTETMVQNVEMEVILRGKVACQMTIDCWNALQQVANEEFTSIQLKMDSKEKYDDDEYNATIVAGEGAIGCIAACANAVLPHILLHYSDEEVKDEVRVSFLELFQSISQIFQRICSHSNRSVRSLALEPLYTLHSKILLLPKNESVASQYDSDLERLVIEHFAISAMNLASRCDYPPHYFDNLHFPSDENLEIERNDVRDLLRAVAAVNDSCPLFALKVTVQILVQVLESCHHAIHAAATSGHTVPETAIHAFSSMAKPVNHLAKNFAGATCEGSPECLFFPCVVRLVLQILLLINQTAHRALLQDEKPIQRLLPLTRIVNISNASYSPFLSAIASLPSSNGDYYSEQLSHIMHFAIHVSILSLEQIPELSAPSILDHSMYDIRGTMRGPGGEDHVGCLTLMRFVEESDILADRVAQELRRSHLLSHVCSLYQQLQTIEQERGKAVVHGRGVTPQTRRILLRTICQLETTCQGQLGAAKMLENLFNFAVHAVWSISNAPGTSTMSDQIHLLAESTLDIAAFTPSIVSTLFTDSGLSYDTYEMSRRTACLDVLTKACIQGYHWKWSDEMLSEDSVIQWNRLRAAVFLLIKRAAHAEALSDRGVSILVACGLAECEAAKRHFSSAGNEIKSVIFRDDIVSPESVAAGLYIRLIGEILHYNFQQPVSERTENSIDRCIEALFKLKDNVLGLVVSTYSTPPEHSFIDPRPTIAEAWLLAMIEIAESNRCDAAAVLLVDTLVAVVTILFYKSMSNTRNRRILDPGMDLDGPHSLCLATFLASFLRRGPRLLCMAVPTLSRVIPIEFDSEHDINIINQDHGSEGLDACILGAALFRGCEGALPPWVIELIPDIVGALFEALGRNPDNFVLFFRSSIYARCSSTQQPIQLPNYSNPDNVGLFVTLQPGQLLAGKSFEVMSEKGKAMFLEEIKRLSQQGGAASWRRMKVLIKQACGGKKDAEYNQKPAMTKWQFERI